MAKMTLEQRILFHMWQTEKVLRAFAEELEKGGSYAESRLVMVERVGRLFKDSRRNRHEFQYWFVPPEDDLDGGDIPKEKVPF